MDRPIPRAKRKLAPLERESAELDLAAEQFIELAGSKRAAIVAIRRVPTKFRGRQKGSKGLRYLRADAQLLWLVNCLQAEWHSRGRITRNQLITKIVELVDCRLDEATATRLIGRWNSRWGKPSVAKLLGCGDYSIHGKEGTVRRLRGRKLFAGGFMGNSMADLKVGVTYYSPPAGLWKALDQQWPDLHLLPGDGACAFAQK